MSGEISGKKTLKLSYLKKKTSGGIFFGHTQGIPRVIRKVILEFLLI